MKNTAGMDLLQRKRTVIVGKDLAPLLHIRRLLLSVSSIFGKEPGTQFRKSVPQQSVVVRISFFISVSPLNSCGCFFVPSLGTRLS